MSDPKVVELGAGSFDEVVDTLCEAFHEYPVMRYVLKDAGPDYDARLALLVGFFTDTRVSRGWPVLGVVAGGRIVAAATLNPPRPEPAPPSLRDRRQRAPCGRAAAPAANRDTPKPRAEPR